jgi:hypothetical protein
VRRLWSSSRKSRSPAVTPKDLGRVIFAGIAEVFILYLPSGVETSFGKK